MAKKNTTSFLDKKPGLDRSTEQAVDEYLRILPPPVGPPPKKIGMSDETWAELYAQDHTGGDVLKKLAGQG